jgi:FMN phosphatase YigB (HAD superfamily)
VAVSFDLFGTLVAVDRPDEPATAVGRELAARGVSPPGDWPSAYAEPHASLPAGRERPLSRHVRDALASRGVEASSETVEDAVLAAFTDDIAVETRESATTAVSAAAASGPVGLCSNCSVRGLVPRVLDRSDVDESVFDAVVTSVDCGWRKPDERAFASDGGVTDGGGEFVDVGRTSLGELADRLEDDP